MIVAYWVFAGLLAAFYLYAGGMKIVRSRQQLLPMMGWIERAPMAAVRTIGVLEVLGAIGLILPPLTGIAPALALYAATGLVLVQVGAIVVHVSRREYRQLGLNVVLLVVAAVAVWLSTVWI